MSWPRAADNEIMRRFHHGLASGLTKQEARRMLKGMVEALQERRVEDIDAWIAEQWEQSCSDSRWKKVSELVAEQTRGQID